MFDDDSDFKEYPELKELGDVYNEVNYIFSKLIEEFRPFAFEHSKGDIADYRHYLFIFLARTWRIYQSISILILNSRLSEAMMIERPLIENIVNTKIFLRRRSRARSMRKIMLYEIINNALYCEFLEKDLNDQIERYGFAFSSSIEVLRDMQKEVNNDLKEYDDLEIDKMKASILKNMGWHGDKINNALSIANMKHYNQTYNLSCMLLHVREPNPLFVTGKVYDKLFLLRELLTLLLDHANDYGDLCKKMFLTFDIFNKIHNNKTKLINLAFNDMKRRHEDDLNYKIIKFNKK